MFKKFEAKDVGNTNQMKSSVQRGIRSKLIERYPKIEEHMEVIMPKKAVVKLIKCHDHIELIEVDNEILFFQQRDDGPYPTLKLLHKYPHILPHQQVDKGAIKFVLSGANIMCPGLTSPGASLNPEPEEGDAVAVMAEGKNHAVAIGKMKMTPAKIKEVNKGIGIDTVHYLRDGLWIDKL